MGEPGVAGLLLAAGAGRRFGMAKALVRHDGRLFVEHAVDALVDGGCAPVVVVLGASAAEVLATAGLGAVSAMVNPRWIDGMGSSLRLGLDHITASAATAVIVSTVDTPGVGAVAVRRLVAMAAPSALARATYHGVPGHPVLIGRDHWAAVRAEADAERGARHYLARHGALPVPCEDVADGTDVDHPGDLDRWRR